MEQKEFEFEKQLPIEEVKEIEKTLTESERVEKCPLTEFQKFREKSISEMESEE